VVDGKKKSNPACAIPYTRSSPGMFGGEMRKKEFRQAWLNKQVREKTRKRSILRILRKEDNRKKRGADCPALQRGRRGKRQKGDKE